MTTAGGNHNRQLYITTAITIIVVSIIIIISTTIIITTTITFKVEKTLTMNSFAVDPNQTFDDPASKKSLLMLYFFPSLAKKS